MFSIFRNTSLFFYCIYLFHKTHVILKKRGINETWKVFTNNGISKQKNESIDKSTIVKIVNRASIFHRKNNQCLEKSLVLYKVLHKYGFNNAVIMIGVDNYPFKSHAWVELNGEVINDSYHFTKSWKVIKSSERGSQSV